jgi:hypothetical protein
MSVWILLLPSPIPSFEEMKKQGFSDEQSLTSWRKQMQAIFPDVKDGTELTALFTAEKTTFYHNEALAGFIEDPQFAKQFSNIWLSEKTSEPSLSKAFLGQL